jgi:flagellar biosynthesis protein FlhB
MAKGDMPHQLLTSHREFAVAPPPPQRGPLSRLHAVALNFWRQRDNGARVASLAFVAQGVQKPARPIASIRYVGVLGRYVTTATHVSEPIGPNFKRIAGQLGWTWTFSRQSVVSFRRRWIVAAFVVAAAALTALRPSHDDSAGFRGIDLPPCSRHCSSLSRHGAPPD